MPANDPASTVHGSSTEYDHLEPLHRRLAAMAPDDPERPALRDVLVRGYHPVAVHIAGRYRNRGEPLDDLEQVGALGLVHAVDRFDPDRGAHFLSFAIPTITGEIRRHFRDRTWSVRVPRRLKDVQTRLGEAQEELTTRLGRAPRVSELAAHLGLPAGEVIDGLAARDAYTADSLDVPFGGSETGRGDLIGTVDREVGLVEDREVLRPAIDALTDRERHILTLRFGAEMTQSQIGQQLGLSQMHISRLLAASLKKLRAGMEG